MNDWRKSLLHALGFKPTPQNLKFLDTWQRWEGGHTNNSARYNWLNTTTGDGQSINSVGVKAFGSYDEGIMNTARTLQNGYYDDILDGLKSGDPYKVNPSRGLQTWVAGPNGSNPEYAQKILGGAAATPLVQRASKAAERWKRHVNTVASSPSPDWDSAMKMIFDDDPEMAEIMAQMDDTVAVQSGVVSKGGSLKQVDLDGKGVWGKVTKIAATQLGKPYVFGSGPGVDSFDCSDLIQWAYKQVGIKLPRTTFDQIKVGRSVKGKKLRPGDLVFPSNHHVVMYVGHGKVIAAPHTGTVVQYQDLSSFGDLLDVRRV